MKMGSNIVEWTSSTNYNTLDIWYHLRRIAGGLVRPDPDPVMAIQNGMAKKLILQWVTIMISPIVMQHLWPGTSCIRPVCSKTTAVSPLKEIPQKTGNTSPMPRTKILNIDK